MVVEYASRTPDTLTLPCDSCQEWQTKYNVCRRPLSQLVLCIPLEHLPPLGRNKVPIIHARALYALDVVPDFEKPLSSVCSGAVKDEEAMICVSGDEFEVIRQRTVEYIAGERVPRRDLGFILQVKPCCDSIYAQWVLLQEPRRRQLFSQSSYNSHEVIFDRRSKELVEFIEVLYFRVRLWVNELQKCPDDGAAFRDRYNGMIFVGR